MDAENVVDTARFNGQTVVEGHGAVAIATGRVGASGVIDENAPHDTGRDSEKMCPTFPTDICLAQQAKIRLVNEGRGLKGVVAPFAREVGGREEAQLAVDGAREGLAGIGVSRSRVGEEVSDAREVGIGHAVSNMHSRVTAWDQELIGFDWGQSKIKPV